MCSTELCCAMIRARIRHVSPLPFGGCKSVSQLVIEDAFHQINDSAISRISVISGAGIRQHGEQPGGIVRPGSAFHSVAIDAAVGVVTLQPVRLDLYLIEQEIPCKVNHSIVGPVLRLNPREHLPAAVED